MGFVTGVFAAATVVDSFVYILSFVLGAVVAVIISLVSSAVAIVAGSVVPVLSIVVVVGFDVESVVGIFPFHQLW